MLRATAKVIIAESLGRRWCPGEEGCPKWHSAQNKDTVCKPCEFNFSKSKLSDVEGSFVAIPWLQHLFYLDGLRRVGATFSVDELTREEWDGLLLLEGVRMEVERERIEREREKANVRAAMQKAK